MYEGIFHMVNIDVPASVGAPTLDMTTKLLYNVLVTMLTN